MKIVWFYRIFRDKSYFNKDFTAMNIHINIVCYYGNGTVFVYVYTHKR
jgi:hypothetical protein